MGNKFYNPLEEARFLGLKVKCLSFKKLNSFLLEKVIYLRESMCRIEKRCAVTYEIVNYLWQGYNGPEKNGWHSENVEVILKQQAARKLVCPDKFQELSQNNSSLDEMLQELEVTKEYLMYYLNYKETMSLIENNTFSRNKYLSLTN